MTTLLLYLSAGPPGLSQRELVNLIVGLASVLATLSAALLAWKKWKPARTNIQVTTADTLVDIAVEAAGIVKVQRDELRTDVDDLKRRLRLAEDGLNDCSGLVRSAERERDLARIEAERKELRLLARIEHLEERLDELRNPG